jgi:hypothetical protein
VELPARIKRYLKRSGMTETRFGREVARDPRLLQDIRNGREIGARIQTRISDWLDRAEQAVR